MAAFVPFLLMGASALGNAFANRGKKSTTEQQTKQTQDMTGTSRPLYDDAQLDVRNFLLRNYMGNLEDMPGVEDAYTRQGLLTINAGADRTANQIRQAMISRGLGRTSAGLSPEIANENARFSQLANFQNSVPLKMDELRRQRLKDFSQFFATLPTGTSQQQSTTTTGNATSTNTQPGNMLGGGLSGLANMAGFLYGSGAFGNSGGGNSYNYDMSQDHQPWEFGG